MDLIDKLNKLVLALIIFDQQDNFSICKIINMPDPFFQWFYCINIKSTDKFII